MATLEIAFLHNQLAERRRRLEEAIALAPQNGSLAGLLREVDSALERMAKGSYGLCEVCHDTVEQDRLLAHAEKLGTYIHQGFTTALQGVNGVKEIRGQGLMIGIELDRPCGDLVKLALAKGLLVNVTADSVIRLLPPLIMTQDEAQQLLDILCPLIKKFLQT